MKTNKYTIESKTNKLSDWDIIEDSMVKPIREEIDKEITTAIMTQLWETELKTLQVKYRSIAEAYEQFENKSIPEYAQFILDYKVPKYSSDETTYFDVQALESDMGELLCSMPDVDKFTYSIVINQ